MTNTSPKPRILIADDLEDIRDLVRLFLDDLDVEIVGEAIDGNSTLELIDSLQPDIIFLDIQMPCVTGLEILDILSKKPKDKNNIFPVIVSGDGDFNTMKTALEKGAQGFIAKPIDENKIIQIIEKYNTSKNQ